MLDVLSRIADSTERATAWAEDRSRRVAALREDGQTDEADALEGVLLYDDGNHGAFMNVLEWTGPAVLTDAVLRYAYRKRILIAVLSLTHIIGVGISERGTTSPGLSCGDSISPSAWATWSSYP